MLSASAAGTDTGTITVEAGQTVEIGTDTAAQKPQFSWILTKDRQFQGAQRTPLFQMRPTIVGSYVLDVSVQDPVASQNDYRAFNISVTDPSGLPLPPPPVHPNIVHGSCYQQLCRLMQMSYAFKVFTPFIHHLMLKRYCTDSILLHERMLGLPRPMDIEFSFQQSINGFVNVKRRTGRPTNANSVGQVKTTWAFYKQLNPRSTDLEGLVCFV
jgi:hypothetical protein